MQVRPFVNQRLSRKKEATTELPFFWIYKLMRFAGRASISHNYLSVFNLQA